MQSWVARANEAYKERLERVTAEDEREVTRLKGLVSAFLGEDVEPVGTPMAGRITIDTGEKWISFTYVDAAEGTLAVIYECTYCGVEIPVPIPSLEALGVFLNEGYPSHKPVCRNQQKD